jgi:hypothetical protein
MRGIRSLVWLGVLSLAATSGCMMPGKVTDFSKQEFAVQGESPVHVALRAMRRDRQVVCQVFLLPASGSARLSGGDLKLANGASLDPVRFKSLEERSSLPAPPVGLSVGFGVGSGRSRGIGHRSGGGVSEWRCGSSPPGSVGTTSGSYRSGFGMVVPVWRLLGRDRSAESPRSVEFSYELPETQATLDGCELAVYVVPGTDGKSKEDARPTDAGRELAAYDNVAAEVRARHPVTFVLAEKRPTDQEGRDATDDTRQKTRELVREIQFTLKDSA